MPTLSFCRLRTRIEIETPIGSLIRLSPESSGGYSINLIDGDGVTLLGTYDEIDSAIRALSTVISHLESINDSMQEGA